MAIGTVVFFWFWSLSLYMDCWWVAWVWRLFGAESGRDWVIGSGIFRFDWRDAPVWTHLTSGALLILYPFWMWLGVQMGYILFGRNERQTGVVGIL